MDKNGSTIKQAAAHFFRTTTLHGFKYLCSKYYFDRVGWVICCGASTCCAGLLCAVLWARFLEVPALLELLDTRASEDVTQFWPDVAVCPPIALFNFFYKHTGSNSSLSRRLSRTVTQVLGGKTASTVHLKKLEDFLEDYNMTLSEVLLSNTPACDELAITCRWQKSIVPCQYLFEKQLTSTGVCCIIKPGKAYNRMQGQPFQPTAYFEQNRMLDMLLDCSNKTTVGCQFFTKYYRETNVETVALSPGYIYIAQLQLTSVPMSSTDEFVQSECILDVAYSKEICLGQCAEQYCGCSDPMHYTISDNEGQLPPCSITQLACLKSFVSKENTSCMCLPSCDKITSDLNVDSTPVDYNTFTLDPVYAEVKNTSTVLHIRLNIALSRMFTSNPTETWLTLLSSLGGVFNMFMGVGVFSALELLFLLIVKLPIAFIKSPCN